MVNSLITGCDVRCFDLVGGFNKSVEFCFSPFSWRTFLSTGSVIKSHGSKMDEASRQ